MAVVIPLCLLLLSVHPGTRGLLADVPPERHDQEMALDADGWNSSTPSGCERRVTHRICRFRGTEWDTEVRFDRGSPEELLDRFEEKLPRLPEDAAPTADAALSLDLLREAPVSWMDGVASSPPWVFRWGDQHSATGVYGGLDAAVTGQPLVVAMVFDAPGDESVLVTMSLRDPDTLWNMMQPLDGAALRSELELSLQVHPLSSVMDKVENETPDFCYTTYMVENDCPVQEIADFYASRLPDLETVGTGTGSVDLLQLLDSADVEMSLFHQPGRTWNRSQTVVKIRRPVRLSAANMGAE